MVLQDGLGAGREARMGEGEARIEELRDEYWDIAFELRRPRAEEAVERDRKRLRAIEDALAELGADVGPRPADLPIRTK